MIAIRSRVDAPACTERSHCSSDTRSSSSATGDAHGSATLTLRLMRSNLHWMRETSSNSRMDSRGIVLR